MTQAPRPQAPGPYQPEARHGEVRPSEQEAQSPNGIVTRYKGEDDEKALHQDRHLDTRRGLGLGLRVQGAGKV